MMVPAYEIRTRRLLLRCWSPTDAPALKATIDRNLDHLRPWMPWAADEPSEIEELADRLRDFRAAFDRDEAYVYGIFDPAEAEAVVIGGTGLHIHDEGRTHEIGYWIDHEHTGQGLATEAVPPCAGSPSRSTASGGSRSAATRRTGRANGSRRSSDSSGRACCGSGTAALRGSRATRRFGRWCRPTCRRARSRRPSWRRSTRSAIKCSDRPMQGADG
jgi:hypothetical protein